MGGGKRAVENGRWKMGGGKNGQRKMGGGKWAVEDKEAMSR